MLTAAFRAKNCSLVKLSNTDLMNEIRSPFPKADFCLFWNKDINLAIRMERSGMRLFNSAHTIEYCNDKCLTAAAATGLPRPKTFIAPHTFLPYSDLSFLDKIEAGLGYPLILKQCFGSFGNQVWLIKNRQELEARVMKITPGGMIFEEYISESYGADLRLHVVGGKCVASVKRIAKEGDFRSNVTNGGKMYPHEATRTGKRTSDRRRRCSKSRLCRYRSADLRKRTGPLRGQFQRPLQKPLRRYRYKRCRSYRGLCDRGNEENLRY